MMTRQAIIDRTLNAIRQLPEDKAEEISVFADFLGDITLDRGTWKIKDNKSLILKTKKDKYIFELIKFGNFLFYIMPSQRQDFVKDFENARKETAHYQIDKKNTRYTREFLMALNLVRKYYGNELIH